jgi:glycosyltransferase involved in cell wall biosynthesis
LPVLDVLLPVRDAEATLSEALASLRAQTLADFRCLVLDDGSRDGSPLLAEAVALRDPRFVVLHFPPRGLVATLNDGLRAVRSPLVARLDADDVAHPERLARQAGFLAENPGVTAVSSRVCFFGDAVSPELRRYEEWLNSLTTHDEIVRDLFVESPLPHPSVLVRSRPLAALGGWRDVGYPEDYDLWLRAWRAGWCFAKLDECLTQIRDHARRLTKTHERYTPRAFLECRAEHLVAAFGLFGADVVIWGAGRDGKRLAKALRRRGVGLRAFVDISPTKIGRRMLGTRVCPPDFLSERPGCLIVAVVGVRGARAEIRGALGALGYREGRDFVCCA